MYFRFLISLFFTVLLAGKAMAGDCYDVSKHQPSELTGALTYIIFAGPPNFEDVAKGDAPEPSYVLHLPEPICIEGDEFADPSDRFDEVQLIAEGEMFKRLKALEDKTVRIQLENPMAATTVHNHPHLLAWVKAVEPALEIKQNQTAKGTVEGFYQALEKGDGARASGFVIPEKNKRGPFSPKALSDFYGTLKEPLKIEEIYEEQPDRFAAFYHYRAGNKICRGSSTVTVEKRAGRYFIKSIKALSAC